MTQALCTDHNDVGPYPKWQLTTVRFVQTKSAQTRPLRGRRALNFDNMHREAANFFGFFWRGGASQIASEFATVWYRKQNKQSTFSLHIYFCHFFW